MQYFRLTAMGKKLFGWEREVDGRRAHWMKLPLDFLGDPSVLRLSDGQRLALLAVGLLCVRRTNHVVFDPVAVRKSCFLRVTPDLDRFMAEGFIELDVTVSQSDSVRGEEIEEKRGEEIEPAAVAAPHDPPPFDPEPEPTTAPGETDRAEPTAVAIVAEPLPWNREAAELWWQEYRGDPPKQIFAQLKPLVRKYTWERVRPALVAYMAETPCEYVNLPKAFAGAFGTWESRARGRPAVRAGPVKGTVGERSLAAMERFVKRGGESDNATGVLEGPGQTGDSGAPGAGRRDP